MGFTSNWLLVQGMTPQEVWERVGFEPTGARSEIPEPPLCGSLRPNGSYLLVEDSAEESVEDTWDLVTLSAGCEVIGVSEVDGAGGAEVVLWRDGRKVWGIVAPMDDEGPAIWGDLPPEILAKVEQDAQNGFDTDDTDDNDDDDYDYDDEYDDGPDYFNAILSLGTSLTGYECGTPIAEPGSKPFELLN